MNQFGRTNMKKSICFYFLITVISMNIIFALDKLPDTQSGKRAKEIIEILNGNSSVTLENYIQNNYTTGFRDAFPVNTHLSIIENTQTTMGNVKIVDITDSTEYGITVVLEAKNGNKWIDLILQVETTKPYRIESMGFRQRPRSESKEMEDQNQSELSGINIFSNFNELDLYLTKKSKENKFSGTILIARYGDPLFHEAYGYSSKRFMVKNKLSTKYNLGSLNKSFTSVAILQLIEKGKIEIDDPIGKYLDIFPEDISGKVTIRHLLTMKSGWGDYWENEYYMAHRNELLTVPDYMKFIKDIPLDFEPGSSIQHCNTGFEVAGAIIEKVSGMYYFDYIRKYIYEPSMMKDTDTYHRDGPTKDIAIGYTNMNNSDENRKEFNWENTYILSSRGTPAGGGYSTTNDMLKYDQALRNNLLISKKYVDFMNNRFQGNIGDPFDPKRASRAAGGAPGVSTLFIQDFVSGYTVIILSNYDFPIAMDVGKDIVKMLKIN
jgi:CubicO group peptidase (beta-lactamase class C family)